MAYLFCKTAIHTHSHLCCFCQVFHWDISFNVLFQNTREREILGFDPKTTYNRFCGDDENECEQPTHWKIVYWSHRTLDAGYTDCNWFLRFKRILYIFVCFCWLCWKYNLIKELFTQKWHFLNIYSPSSHLRCRWICFFIRKDQEKFSIILLVHQWLLCSEWVPLE